MAESLTTVTQRLAQASSRVVQLPAGHAHVWRHLPDTLAFFVCRDPRCLWCGVCPGCLGSLQVALQVQRGIDGLVLAWCPVHQGAPGQREEGTR